MQRHLSRKSFLRSAAQGAACAALGFGTGLASTEGKDRPEPVLKPLPWPYVRLDPETVRRVAHDCFYEQGCGYAGFAGIIKELRTKVGMPFDLLPLELMSFAGAGVKGWGTLCGALNGACAVISLVTDPKTSGRVIDELILWYGRSPLPSETSNSYGAGHRFGVDKGISLLLQSVSGSPLCHVSTTKWCIKAGHAVESPERYERCARLSGDVAAQAVLLLNSQVAGVSSAASAVPQETAACLDCHGPKGQIQNVVSKMDCSPCHSAPHP